MPSKPSVHKVRRRAPGETTCDKKVADVPEASTDWRKVTCNPCLNSEDAKRRRVQRPKDKRRAPAAAAA